MEHRSEFEVNCPRCGKFLGYVDGDAELKCQRCKSIVTVTKVRPPEIKIQSVMNAR